MRPSLAFFAMIPLALATFASLGACGASHEETRAQCTKRCGFVYEDCAERSLGGDTLNRCGESSRACYALCPAR